MRNKTVINWKDVLFCSGDLGTKLIKLADYLFGSALCVALRPAAAAPLGIIPERVKSILVLRPGGIGDAILLIPFIRELKKLFPAARIDVFCQKRNAQVFKIEEGLVSLVSLRQIFRKKYDIVFDSEQWHNSSALITYFTGSKCRVGFDTRARRSKFYTHLIPYSQEEYETVNFMNLLKPFRESSLRGRQPEAISFSDCFVGLRPSRNDSQGTRRIAICMSAGIPERRWPQENFQKLIAYLEKKGYNILLLGGKKEKRLSLPEAAALLAASSLYIGSDTGLLHIAYALGLPTVSLFGPGIKDKWAPRGDRHIAISKEVPCSPCTLFGYTPRCRQPKCMELIASEDVIKAIESQKSRE